MDYRKVCEKLIAELREERDLRLFYYDELRKTEEILRLDPDIETEKEIAALLENNFQLRAEIDNAIKLINKALGIAEKKDRLGPY